jgi:hypothetical protein
MGVSFRSSVQPGLIDACRRHAALWPETLRALNGHLFKDEAADEGFQVLEEVFNLDGQLAAESTTT